MRFRIDLRDVGTTILLAAAVLLAGVAAGAVVAAFAEEPPLAAEVFARIAPVAIETPAAVTAAVGAPALPAAAPVAAPPNRQPAWQRNAVAAVDAGEMPRIAVVIDDVGVHVPNAWRVIALPGPLTLSLMTYARNLPQVAAAARERGHELMLHVPMEPEGDVNPGPNVLLTGVAPDELQRRLQWALERAGGVVGVNNHMGSRFTADRGAMDMLMAALAARGLLFVDSVTTGQTVGRQASRGAGVPYLARDIFLDNEPDVASVRARLQELEAIARRQGSAIAIAHPKAGTIEALQEWLPTLRERGFALVPITALVAPASPQVAGR